MAIPSSFVVVTTLMNATEEKFEDALLIHDGGVSRLQCLSI